MGSDDDLPIPLLERGDVVKLREPYLPGVVGSLAESLAFTIKSLAWAKSEELRERFPYEGQIPITAIAGDDDLAKLLEFDHGIVAQVVSRYPARRDVLPEGRVVQYDDVGGGPVRNVSLFLFNPDAGTLYLTRGPGDRGIPAFVDHHATDLTLIQKHNETYGHRVVDIAGIYDDWGVVDVADQFTEDEADG